MIRDYRNRIVGVLSRKGAPFKPQALRFMRSRQEIQKRGDEVQLNKGNGRIGKGVTKVNNKQLLRNLSDSLISLGKR